MSAPRAYVAPVKPRPPYRMIAASFAAGVGAMMLVGLVAPTIAMGGLSMRNAAAATLEQREPLVAPLDVPAIEAQLAAAESTMNAARQTTDPMVSRLESLAQH